MNIVVLDGQTTNPGDLSWSSLEKLGNLTVYDNSTYEQIVERAENASAVILCRAPFDADIISKLPKLKYIGTLATGYNTIDIDAARKKNILISNVPSYCTETVSQHVFALLLSLANHIPAFSGMSRSGRWDEAVIRAKKDLNLLELTGKKMGILGFGTLGIRVAEISRVFGMNVLVNTRTPKKLPVGYRPVSLEELFSESDVISIHCPLNNDTKGLIDIDLIKKMKKQAILINTARGAIIKEKDLADALNQEIIAGAGIDVMTDEPPAVDNPLLNAKNCIITPHISWSSKEARGNLIEKVAANLKAFILGNPINTVN